MEGMPSTTRKSIEPYQGGCFRCKDGLMRYEARVASRYAIWRYKCDKCAFVECYAADPHLQERKI
jgi:hypothetical protein